MLHLPRKKKHREYEYKERKDIGHGSEKTETYVMHRSSEGTGCVHNYGEEKEKTERE